MGRRRPDPRARGSSRAPCVHDPLRRLPRLKDVIPTLRNALIALLAAALLVVVAAGCGGQAGAGTASPSPTGGDPVVARVNGRDVRQSDVDLARAEARLVGQDDSSGAGMDAAIDGALVAAEAERLKVSADPDEVDRRLTALRDQMGGEKALQAALKKTQMTKEQLRTSLEQGVVREAVQDARYPDVKATTAAVRAFYDENRAKLFTTAASWALGALVVRNEGIAGNAVKRLEQGRPFEEVARQFSTDPELKTSGGLMGWMAPSALPAPLRKAVAKLGTNEITPPTKGPGGVWVLKLLDKRPAAVVPFAKVRDQIQQGLDGQKRSTALAAWLERARKDAEIQRL
jgi:parvulin-like peptidyl-prolyl isomerase